MKQTAEQNLVISKIFLVACARLYKSLCRSVLPSVGRSVVRCFQGPRDWRLALLVPRSDAWVMRYPRRMMGTKFDGFLLLTYEKDFEHCFQKYPLAALRRLIDFCLRTATPSHYNPLTLQPPRSLTSPQNWTHLEKCNLHSATFMVQLVWLFIGFACASLPLDPLAVSSLAASITCSFYRFCNCGFLQFSICVLTFWTAWRFPVWWHQ